MILRRFTKHLGDQNWFAVGLDVIVVVVGIFLGLQFTDWNDRLKQQKTGQEFLQRLKTDLELDVTRMQHKLNFDAKTMSYVDIAMQYSDAGVSEDESLWLPTLAFYQASQLSTFEATNITFEELRSAGQLGLVQSADLRSQLAYYYSFNESFGATILLQHLPPYRSNVRGYFSGKLTDYIWQNCHKVNALHDQEMVDCPSSLPADEALELLETITANEVLMHQLRDWKSNITVGRSLIVSNLAMAKDIVAVIDEELQR
jgi:hypothetical protein